MQKTLFSGVRVKLSFSDQCTESENQSGKYPMLFFERMKTQRGEWPKTFEKNHFPHETRSQCWQILSKHIPSYEGIVEVIREAVGRYTLNNEGRKHADPMYGYNFERELNHFFHFGLEGGDAVKDIEYAFSVLEIMLRTCSRSNNYSQLIEGVNSRLRFSGIGYKYENGFLLPVDDEELTNDSVIPAISLLNRDEFKSAYGYLHQSFLDYKAGNSESSQSAIDNTVKAVEAALKTIFEKLGIEYSSNDTYMPLIQKAKENNLFPAISIDKTAPIANELKALGEIRNKEGGHGAPDKKVSDKAVRLAIHHATANLLYIVESYLERKQ